MATKRKGLGRGLDALLGGAGGTAKANTNASDISADQPLSSDEELKHVPVDLIQRGKYQPRRDMHPQALEELAESIKAQGVMQPIVIRPIGADKYEIIAGERRWRASQLAGLAEVPVLIREIEDESALAMALIENIQRENLNPLEEALGIKRLIDEFAMSHEQAARAVGRSRTAVSNLLRLIGLSEPVKALLMDGRLDMGHARALIGLEPAQQILLANQVIQQGLSVREVEALVSQQGQPETNTLNKKTTVDPDVLNLQNRLSDRLGAKVKIAAKSNGAGSVKINYANLAQLDDLISKLEQ